ncbi:MAG TPA: hypothetical protein VJU78_18645 [Chitinophagaceae bacterium]|nr:hypothetical protein [Chitinophagaceae bacterium]
MKWKNVKYLGENKYDLPGDWLKIEYFEAINILFRIENSLRVFVYVILKNEFKDKWKDLAVTSDDDEQSTLNAIAKKRLNQDKNYAYLGFTLNSPLLHLTSGELIRIITSDCYWKFFKRFFLGTKEIIKNKLDEIGNVRNSVAHFRPIKKGDIDLIKQNAIHTLSEIEKAIRDFITCPDIVPSNTDENWYKEIVVLGTEECKISFNQSKKEQWLKLILSFNSPILNKTKSLRGFILKTFKLKTNNLLNSYQLLTNHAICVTEFIPLPFFENPDSVYIEKEIRFTFSKKSFSEYYKIIKEEIEKLLFQISSELTLIKEDNLARGKIIEATTTGLNKIDNSNYYDLETDQFITELDEDSPVEFWGTLNHCSNDFITETERYPWMPVDISEDKGLPF